MSALRRLSTWVGFVLSEYGRSGRIVIELVLTIAMWGLFFQRQAVPISMANMFSITGLFSMALAMYSTSALLSMADRPQSYVVLTRPLGRRGFLLGIYLAAVLLVWLMVALVLALTVAVNRPESFTARGLLLGAAPVLLNVALLAAVMLLLSSLVVKNITRLIVLAVLAIALYSNTWNLSPIYQQGGLAAAQAVFSRVIEPGSPGSGWRSARTTPTAAATCCWRSWR